MPKQQLTQTPKWPNLALTLTLTHNFGNLISSSLASSTPMSEMLSPSCFALNLPRKYLRILVGLLTGHADLHRHLHIMRLRQVSHLPPLSGGREHNCPLHCSVQCSNASPEEHSWDYILSSETLSNIHWFLLLKFTKASKRFDWSCGLSGLHTEHMLWPHRPAWSRFLFVGVR